MKRTFAKLLSLFVVLTLVIAMVPAVFAAGEAVSAGKTTLAVGEDTTISVTDASGAPVPNVKLSSSPADIVEISNMDVTAKKVGTAVITATVTEGETTRTLGSVTITVQSAVNAITPASSAVEIDADGGPVVRRECRDGPGFGRRFDQLLCHADGGEDRHGCGHAQLRPGHTGAGRCDCQGDERPYRDL